MSIGKRASKAAKRTRRQEATTTKPSTKPVGVFLSWSGKRSGHVADCFQRLLKRLFGKRIDLFKSSDLAPGADWRTEITNRLTDEATKAGLVILTQWSVESDWVLFESGAMIERLLIPVLVDLGVESLPSVIGNKNAIELFDDECKNQVWKIIGALGRFPGMSQPTTELFEKAWTVFERSLERSPAESPNTLWRCERELRQTLDGERNGLIWVFSRCMGGSLEPFRPKHRFDSEGEYTAWQHQQLDVAIGKARDPDMISARYEVVIAICGDKNWATRARGYRGTVAGYFRKNATAASAGVLVYRVFMRTQQKMPPGFEASLRQHRDNENMFSAELDTWETKEVFDEYGFPAGFGIAIIGGEVLLHYGSGKTWYGEVYNQDSIVKMFTDLARALATRVGVDWRSCGCVGDARQRKTKVRNDKRKKRRSRTS